MRDGNGKVLYLYPLLPDRMIVDRDANDRLYYQYQTDKGLIILSPEEVLHIPGGERLSSYPMVIILYVLEEVEMNIYTFRMEFIQTVSVVFMISRGEYSHHTSSGVFFVGVFELTLTFYL